MANVSPTAPWSTQDSTWLASAAQTATFTTETKGADRFVGVIVLVKVSAVSGTTPTLDVKLQTLMPDGSTWCDIAAMTQITSALNKALFFLSSGSAEYTVVDGTLTAGTIKTVPLGRVIRVKGVIGGTNPSFTLSIQILSLQ